MRGGARCAIDEATYVLIIRAVLETPTAERPPDRQTPESIARLKRPNFSIALLAPYDVHFEQA